MRYVTKSCPHCGWIYMRSQPASNFAYGSPFRTCEKCKGKFIDKDYNELALIDGRPVGSTRFQPGTIAICIAPILVFLFGLYYFFDTLNSTGTPEWGWLAFGAVVAGVAVFLLSEDAKGYAGRVEFLKKEKQLSEERLSNPDYARALQEIGIKVPDKYLYPKERTVVVHPAQNDSGKGKARDVVERFNKMMENVEPESEKSNDQEEAGNQTAKTVFCRKCGAKIPEDSDFCPRCGVKTVKIE